MGAALLKSWQAHNINANFLVIDPHKKPKNSAYASDITKAKSTLAKTDLIILAIKPQSMNDVCTDLKKYITDKTPILSIAAGQSITRLQKQLHTGQPIIRSMPNTPAAIGKGITVALANKSVTAKTKSLAGKLLSCAGKLEWIKNEKLFDAVTALSGSGPAYVFYLIETLTNAGIKSGLPKPLAENLARQTVIGSAALSEASKETPAKLRQNVTSPGGTTEAALKILMNGEMQKIFDQALAIATARSKELNN